MTSEGKILDATDILDRILGVATVQDLHQLFDLEPTTRLTERNTIIATINEVVRLAKEVGYQLRYNAGRAEAYNGCSWVGIDEKVFERFLGKAALQFGVDFATATYHMYWENRESSSTRPPTSRNRVSQMGTAK